MVLRPWLKAVALGAAFATATAGGHAAADPTNPAALVPALGVYIDSIVVGHAEAAACAPENSPARNEKGWAEAKAVLIATLWANGFPTDAVNDATRRLEGAPPAATLDCSAAAVAANAQFAVTEGWPQEISRAISGMELTPVTTPVGADQWQAIKDAIAAELPLQARLLDCLSVTQPGVLLVMVHDWDAMIVKIGNELVVAGLPRDAITAALSPAEANSVWHPISADKVPALRSSCAGDQTWNDRLLMFEFLTLGGKIEKLLPMPPDSGDN